MRNASEVEMSEKPGFQLLDVDGSDENLLAYELNKGDVTDDELAPYWKRFDEAVKEGRRLRIYAEMHAKPKFGDGLVLEKLKRIESAKSIIERMAIVGDAKWLPGYAKIMAPVMRVEIRHFPMGDNRAAIDWVLESRKE